MRRAASAADAKEIALLSLDRPRASQLPWRRVATGVLSSGPEREAPIFPPARRFADDRRAEPSAPDTSSHRPSMLSEAVAFIVIVILPVAFLLLSGARPPALPAADW